MSVPVETLPDTGARKAWLGLLARADAARLAGLWADFRAALGSQGDGVAEHATLRAPEIGLVMVRGRAGATGAPFNLGEMSVTRCAVRLMACGTVGHGYVQGRDRDHARTAALVDALMQTGAAGAVRAAVLDPLAQAETAARRTRAEKAAATRVEFFTLVRGDD